MEGGAVALYPRNEAQREAGVSDTQVDSESFHPHLMDNFVTGIPQPIRDEYLEITVRFAGSHVLEGRTAGRVPEICLS